MAEQLFRSQLGKTPTGYRWVWAVPWGESSEEQPRAWFLTDGALLSHPATQEWETLLYKNPEAFLEFARLHPLQDMSCKVDYEKKQVAPLAIDPDSPKLNGIRDFANRYGLLTTKGKQIETPEGPFTDPCMGEPYSLWREEIEEMHFAVKLWQMLSRSASTKRLQQVIRWHSDEIVFYDPSGQWKEHARGTWKPILQVTPLKKGEYEKAAWCYLATAVNQSLIPVQRRPYRLLTPRLEFEQRRPIRVGLHFVSDTRLGELWLQFAQAIDKGREYRQCLYCKEAFIVGTGVKQNKKRVYCTDSHRALAWRKRKAEQLTPHKKRKLNAA